MGMASDLLERLSEDLEVLSLHTRAYLDEFGTLLCYLEGGRGGGTTLLHAPYTEALPVLQALNGLAFRGRVLLALDPSPLSPTLEGLPSPGPPAPPWSTSSAATARTASSWPFTGKAWGGASPGGRRRRRAGGPSRPRARPSTSGCEAPRASSTPSAGPTPPGRARPSPWTCPRPRAPTSGG